MSDNRRVVERAMESALEDAFDKIELNRDGAPSEIMRILERDWGLGDRWAEWWQAFDSEGWE